MLQVSRTVASAGRKVARRMSAEGIAGTSTLRDYVNDVCVKLKVPHFKRKAFISRFLSILAGEFNKVQ